MPLSKEKYEELKRKRLCYQCRSPTSGKVRCDDCTQKNEAARKQRREERKALGQCPECGCKAMPGCSLCQQCSNVRTEAATRRYYQNKQDGCCRFCGAPTGGKSRCPKHKQQLKDWRQRQKLKEEHDDE